MQYFQVGEEVILQSKNRPELNGEYVVAGFYKPLQLVENPFGENYKAHNSGCSYTLEGLCQDTLLANGATTEAYIHWDESALRKKHQGGESFESLMSSMKDGTLEALDG